MDCIIVGAGIVGAACALACAEAGLRVAVVDRGPVAGGATAAAMGHCVLLGESPAQLALTRRSQQLWEALRPRLPASAEYQQIGTLWVAATGEEMAEVERQHAHYAGLGLACKVLGPDALAAEEPNLRRLLAGALYMPGDSVLAPVAVAGWLLEQAVGLGANLLHGEAVGARDGELGLTSGQRLKARLIVIATGVNAAALVPGLPLRSRKGQLVLTSPSPSGLDLVCHQVVELGYLASAHGLQARPAEPASPLGDDAPSVAFNVQPRAGGRLLIGSSRQYGVEHAEVDQPVLGQMMARAEQYLPGLCSLPVERVWAGFRAATPDSLPLIGPAGPAADQTDHSDPTIFLATGHEGLGITTSLATAELLVDHLVGRVGAIPPGPYLPARFNPSHALRLAHA
jgi:glycine/D-amino acid oxidase-like deaminating enzyme